MTNPQTFRRRPIEIKAVQWAGTNPDELSVFCSPFDFMEIEPEDRVDDPDETAAVRESKHNTWHALKPGDWVVGRGSDLAVLSPEEFADLYEPAVVVEPPATRAADRDRIAQVIREFPFDDFGLDDVSYLLASEPDTQEWVPRLADAMLGVLPPPADRAAVLREAAEAHPEDDDGDELACVDECGCCDACGMEPFGTPAEGWREAARFLRRTARDSADRQGALHGARLIEAELRRMADEAQQPETEAHADPKCVCGHPVRLHHEDVCLTADCDCADCLEPEGPLPDRLEAVLTRRFTELGNPGAQMRYHEQGPDGWPASHPVGPRMVAEVLRELLADEEGGTRRAADEEQPSAGRVRHSGPNTKFCVLCLSGEHERVDETPATPETEA